MVKINKSPIRTSKNFHINSIKIEDKNLKSKIGKFDNAEIIGKVSNINIDNKLTYGLSEELEKQIKDKANQKITFEIKDKKLEERKIDFKFDKDNINLVDNIHIIAKENSTGIVTIKYESQEDIKAYHNGTIYVKAYENAKLDIFIINLMNDVSTNFLSIETNIEENASVNYTIIDLGAKISISNYYSNLIGNSSKSNINTIYLGKDEDIYDLNYIVHLRGEKSIAGIEVQGALKDNAKKNFKGTIDFKKGCKKAKGEENESCLLLSDSSKSLALPMLLCSEEDVEGAHSTSTGKIGNKELFYIMSRGFNKKQAEKLLVRAKFNKILDNIKDDKTKTKILKRIDAILK